MSVTIDKRQVLTHLKAAAFLEGDFTTRAGKKTSYYIDKYLFETLPEILDPLTTHLAALFPPPDTYDRIAAPELGAVSLAAVLSVKLKKPFVIVKKKTKDYGTKKLIEGAHHAGERYVVIEDILTTGGAVLNACDVLTNAGMTIVHIIGVLNREEGADEAITQKGFTVQSLYSKTELLTC